jgi:DNA ligase-1
MYERLERPALVESFAALLDALVYTRSRNEKLRLIAEYLRATPDPDRGWALAALTDGLNFPAVKASTIRNLLTERVDPVLWVLSRDFVGDTAETASLLWPAPDQHPAPPTVSEAVDALAGMTRKSVASELPALLDRLDPSGRYALLKLATGAMRIGISSRLAKVAFAQAFEVPVEDVEEHWHGLAPPYLALFAWAAHGEAPPDTANMPTFRPFMLAHPLEATVVDLADYAAEWKWDGIRVQLVRMGGATRLYSRSGDDISATFPELLDALPFDAVLDGELLVRGSHQGGEAGGAASFNALQQRLGRKVVSKKTLFEYPAFVRLYDVLILEGRDLRELPWSERRAELERLMPRLPNSHFDLSQVVDADDFEHLATIRAGARDEAIEGLMLKRRDSPYIAGR